MSNVTFAFTAVRPSGAVETGVVEAETREAAASLISARGAFPVTVARRSAALGAHARIGGQDLALGLRALATLLQSGIPLARALAILDDLAPPAWKSALPDLRHRVEQGQPLGVALEASSLRLPGHVIGILRAGEAGSGLAAAVEQAAQLLETRAATRAALRSALAYPAMLAVAGGASVTLLVTVVLPRFASLLIDYGQSLPLSTRVVLGIGTVAKVLALPTIAALAGATFLWRRWVREPTGERRWHSLLLAAPVLGTVRRSAAAASACSALAALLDVGVPLDAALPHAARATGDRAVEASLLTARKRIETGDRVSAALHAVGALTPTVVRLVRVGEETGQLGAMLAHAARIEAQHAQQLLQRAIRVIEPLLILAFGGIVMLVAAALLQAMYGLRPS